MDTSFYENIDGIVYRFATLDDLDEIRKLWNRNTKVLKRYYVSTLQDEIQKGLRIVAYSGQQLVGMCGIKKKRNENHIKLNALCVHKDYRRNHIGKNLIKIIQRYGLEIYAEAVNGADNNKFYESIGEKISERMSKSGTLKLNLYKINKL